MGEHALSYALYKLRGIAQKHAALRSSKEEYYEETNTFIDTVIRVLKLDPYCCAEEQDIVLMRYAAIVFYYTEGVYQ